MDRGEEGVTIQEGAGSITEHGLAARCTQKPILWPQFQRKETFICQSTGKNTEGKTQICLTDDPRFGVTLVSDLVKQNRASLCWSMVTNPTFLLVVF